MRNGRYGFGIPSDIVVRSIVCVNDDRSIVEIRGRTPSILLQRFSEEIKESKHRKTYMAFGCTESLEVEIKRRGNSLMGVRFLVDLRGCSGAL